MSKVRALSDQELAEFLLRKDIITGAPAFVAPVSGALSRAEEDRRIAALTRPRQLTKQEYLAFIKKRRWDNVVSERLTKLGKRRRLLSPEQVAECRDAAVSMKSLARKFGVSDTTIKRIRRREAYKDLP